MVSSENEEQGGTQFDGQFDHAGIATDSAADLASLYCDVLGCDLVHEETFQEMKIIFLDIGNGYFELLEPLDADGPIANYLENRGAGIHHLAIKTSNIEVALERASEHNVELIDEKPRPGAWGHEVAFLHPKSTGGVLLEFVQR